jgi:hypothetical protein
MAQTTELLKAMQGMIWEKKADMKINLKEMRDEMTARIEARIDGNNEKFEVLRSTLVSQWISTKPEQKPFKKKKDGSHYEYLAK